MACGTLRNKGIVRLILPSIDGVPSIIRLSRDDALSIDSAITTIEIITVIVLNEGSTNDSIYNKSWSFALLFIFAF